MGLRSKTLMAVGLTIILMILIIYSITEKILLGGYTKLEKENITQGLNQTIQMVDDELLHLKSIVGDWAPWDDTYQFIQDGNQEYIDDNLGDSSIINLNVNFLIYINTVGKIVNCKFMDLETGEELACPDSIGKLPSDNSFLLRSQNNSEVIAGLILLPGSPFLLAAAPILTSQFKGPVMGTLIAGRYLDHAEVKRIGSKLHLSIDLQKMENSQLPDDFQKAIKKLSPENKIPILELNDNIVAAYTTLFDMQDTASLILKVSKERKIFAQGVTGMKYLLFSLLITGVVIIIVTLVILERMVLSRMFKLNEEVKNIGKTGNLFSRTSVSGGDELADLSCEINQMLESVRVSTERDRAILETIEDGYFELDTKGSLTLYNNSLARLFKYKQTDIRVLNYHDVLSESSTDTVLAAFKSLYKTGNPIKLMVAKFKRGDGAEIYLESTISIIKSSDGEVTGVRGITRDVTERKKTSEQLLYMVYHDTLTGLLNRKAFQQNLERELSHADRYGEQRSLLFIDLDKFKTVNDTYGHDAGDQLLQGFAIRAGKTLRETDSIYRLGGDEFAILLANPKNQRPETAAQRVVDITAKPFLLESHTIDFVTASIGISIFPDHGHDIETLLQRADSAMYEAKEKGNCFSIYGKRKKP